ncbi:glycoside hydrolase family 2 TIM barrel-domain containing protein [Porphyromonas pogonae]|uniref:glycoside hydrolase family 2 TIM barrel-domain containing protein n=1 Tax=Porphyromonas pogonae TaxID=867595 RepID=UPI0038B5FD83
MNRYRHFWLLMSLLSAMSWGISAQSRIVKTLEEGWKFTRQDKPDFSAVNYNDTKWQSVTVPHDWAIYGPFSYKNDMQHVAIAQDGQKEAMEHAGRTGGLPFVGVGWYRTYVQLPSDIGSHKVSLKFDGAMSHAKVYVNGDSVGYWPYGYNTFILDIDKAVKPGKNVIAVRLENPHESSRWYPGAGLYRNVHLIIQNKVNLPEWGTFIQTPEINDRYAQVDITSRVSGLAEQKQDYALDYMITDVRGNAVQYASTSVKKAMSKSDSLVAVTTRIDNPALWDINKPNLYHCTVTLKNNVGEVLDQEVIPFGVRSIKLVQNEGFFLNGRKLKFKGVCLHHDLGPLGGAVNVAAMRRQIKQMQDMGANAIRTSHNMPAPEFIKLCDEMGMMVMAESFDSWAKPKVANGYNRDFAEWHRRDLTNLIHQFRNNASIVMWSIGNEVPEQWDADGAKMEYELQQLCHMEDPTRPVTNGMDAPDAVLKNSMAAILDVPGFNYRPFKYNEAHKVLPQGFLLGSETASTVSSRGVYKFPVERKSMAKYDDHQSSSYDVEHCGWSNLPEDDFIRHDDLPWSMGEFVWTGIDYLGEPTPYYSEWPSHSSLFGIVDLAGIPKDRYYLYKSHWNPSVATLHILPHWTWPGREGKVTPIFVYTNYPEAELFINGKSQGRIKKDMSVTADNSEGKEHEQNFTRQKRYRLMWMNTVYEPGTVKVVAYDAQGREAAVREVKTAGKPYKVQLKADRNEISADGKDISFVTVSIVDKDGNLCPDDDRLLIFDVKGVGHFKAAASGNPASLDQFHLPRHHAFSGMLTVLVQSSKKKGQAILTVSAKGLKSASVTINTK